MTGENLSLEGMASNLDSGYGRVVDGIQRSRCAELSWLMHSHGELPRTSLEKVSGHGATLLTWV